MDSSFRQSQLVKSCPGACCMLEKDVEAFFPLATKIGFVVVEIEAAVESTVERWSWVLREGKRIDRNLIQLRWREGEILEGILLKATSTLSFLSSLD